MKDSDLFTFLGLRIESYNFFDVLDGRVAAVAALSSYYLELKVAIHFLNNHNLYYNI